MWSTYVVGAFFIGYLAFRAYVGPQQSHGPPHLIFILADDFGWNDIGYHNPDIISPNMDSLAFNGIRLNQSYMQQMCTPSRSAVLTGYYPFRTGLQHGVIWRLAPFGLPLRFTLLPEKLKDLGYETHLVGKWHLGYCSLNYTPTYRGFDSFMGAYTGATTYFNHSFTVPGSREFIDFYNATVPTLEYQGIHSSVAFIKQVEYILSTRDTSKPLFLYLPFTLPHEPLEVQDKYLNLYPDAKDGQRHHVDRRIYSAMISALDDDVGQVVALLKKFNIYQDSIIIFSSDNGGHINNGASNFPLRGNKNTLYEGGTRTVAFIHSPLLKVTGYVYNGLIHAVDWFATLVRLAGGQTDNDIDGIDVWDSIIENEPSPRTEFIYNIDNFDQKGFFSAAIRDREWKLIIGYAGLPNGTYIPENITYKYEQYRKTDFLLHEPDEPWFHLYNIQDDPYEINNLAEHLPHKVEELHRKLKEYEKLAVKPLYLQNDLNAVSVFTDGFARPGWCEPQN